MLLDAGVDILLQAQLREDSPVWGVLPHFFYLLVIIVDIRLKYTNGASWTFKPVSPRRRSYEDLIEETYQYRVTGLLCNWLTLISYMLSDSELKKSMKDRSSSKPRRRTMTWLFEATYRGMKHRKIYVLLTDDGGDNRYGMMCCNIGNTKIWNSLRDTFDVYLRDKIEGKKPTEFTISFKYVDRGVATRESRDGELWTFYQERGSRKSFESKLELKDILTKR